MTGSPGSQPLYNWIYWGALACWFAIELVSAFRQRRASRRREAENRDQGSYLLVVGSLVLGVLIAGVLSRVPAGDLHWNQPVTVSLAALMILGGIAFRAYAVRTLGRYFTNDVAVSGDQPVIQAGPYRLIRHPAYTGTLVSALGVGLGMTNWLSLIAVAAGFFIGHLYRVNIEERAMAASIGEPYVAYMRRTKRFIPHLF